MLASSEAGALMIEVRRSLKQGFKIDPAALRLLNANMAGHIAKTAQPGHERIHALFRDGTRQPIANLEDVFQLQNSGPKTVESLELEFMTGPDKSSSTHFVSVAASIPSSERSEGEIEYRLVADDRTWIRAVQSDLDEFCSLVKRLDLSGPLRWALPIAMILFIGGMLLTIFMSPNDAARLGDLRQALSREMSPADAMFAYAEWQAQRGSTERAPFFFAIPALLLMIVSVFRVFGSRDVLYKCHIFYFGNMVETVRQRRFYHTLFWSGVVLAAGVGVLANYASRFLLPN